MGFLDSLKSSVSSAATSAAGAAAREAFSGQNLAAQNPDGLAFARSERISLGEIPTSVAALARMDGADLRDPNKVVALTVAALCLYPIDKENSIAMLNFLKGPRPLSNYEIQFLADRFRGKDYLAASYLDGATPQNNYEPKMPLTVVVYETGHSKDQIDEGYLQLFLKSGGADSGRSVKLRHKPSTGQWFLWEYHILPDIRKPVAEDPWA